MSQIEFSPRKTCVKQEQPPVKDSPVILLIAGISD